MDMDLELQLPTEPHAPRAARHVIDGLAGQLSEDIVERFRLVVSELVTNAVRHAPEPARPIRILAHIDERVIRVDVIDRDDWLDVPEPPPVPEPEAEWGLFLVDRLTDRWGTNVRRGSGVWCEFDLAAGGLSVQSGGSSSWRAMLR